MIVQRTRRSCLGQVLTLMLMTAIVTPFDRNAVIAELQKIGLKIIPSPDEPEVVRFADNNDITVELKPS